MAYHAHYRLNADQVALLLTLIDNELASCHSAGIPFNTIDWAIDDPDEVEDAIADTRYVTRLAHLTQILSHQA